LRGKQLINQAFQRGPAKAKEENVLQQSVLLHTVKNFPPVRLGWPKC